LEVYLLEITTNIYETVYFTRIFYEFESTSDYKNYEFVEELSILIMAKLWVWHSRTLKEKE